MLEVLPSVRKIAIESTAIGIDAETVRPTFTARYTDDAAKTIPRNEPRSNARNVNSVGDWLAGM